MPQGSVGEIHARHDFLGTQEDVTWATTSVDLGEGWGMVSVNEGTIQDVTDDEGGIRQFLTDIGDDDNVALFSGPYRAANGPISCEFRFKIADDVTVGAVFAGFSETLAKATPVMPAEFATVTMTYNGTGGMLGALWDPDGTTDIWRALSGDGGAVSGSAAFGANGTAGDNAMVNDEWDIVRVVLHPDGWGEVWHDDELIAQGATGLTPTDRYYAVLMCENRSAAAEEFEVDYCEARGVRDWAVT